MHFLHWLIITNILLILPAYANETVGFQDCEQCPEMISIKGGSFLMGDDSRPATSPRHEVTLKSFAIGRFEVTQQEWRFVMSENPSRFSSCTTCPVEQVTWPQAQDFVKRLSEISGKKYSLPSEAQWEYACRAGQSTNWCGGDVPTEVAWSGDEYGSTHPVGGKRPNAWGLNDMSGNVWEWTNDCSAPNYIGAPTDGTARDSKEACKARVLRGGSWLSGPQYGQSVLRLGFSPNFKASDFGLRVVREE